MKLRPLTCVFLSLMGHMAMEKGISAAVVIDEDLEVSVYKPTVGSTARSTAAIRPSLFHVLRQVASRLVNPRLARWETSRHALTRPCYFLLP